MEAMATGGDLGARPPSSRPPDPLTTLLPAYRSIGCAFRLRPSGERRAS